MPKHLDAPTPRLFRPHRFRHAAALVGALGAISFAGCVYDANDRCSANEVLDGKKCVCVAGAAMTDHGCVLCGEHEVPTAGECVCADGYMRSGANATCVPVPTALGAACDTTATPCSDPTYDFCQPIATTQGYCTTSGCASSADCVGGYACDTTASPAYCKRPPTGLGQACQSAADCASYEATYCEAVQTHECMVEGCTLSPDDCFEGYECCDLTALGLAKTLCVPVGGCPT